MGLKDFQRDTVSYVLDRLYDSSDPTDRFLVADEVGMGKTLVARGVIDGAIKRLRADESVDRIDVIYICSNAAIAAQNIGTLHEGVENASPLSTRISMLATQLTDLDRKMEDGSKTINFVAITPGTSFSHGAHEGRVVERALLHWMLEPLFEAGRVRNAFTRVMQAGVMDSTWLACRGELGKSSHPNESVTAEFRALLNGDGSDALTALRSLVVEMTGRYSFNDDQKRRRREVIGRLRRALAKASVNALEPDLVILDEFQRFKSLINEPQTPAEVEVKELADELFDASTAKLLLLSATPYKAYTLAEEKSEDDHYSDFIETIRFLEGRQNQGSIPALRKALGRLRTAAVTEGDPEPATIAVEKLLRPLMCRTERPVEGRADMRLIRKDFVKPPTSADLLGYVAMKHIAKEVDGQLSVDYWKSAPYFLNFMDGYKLAEKFKQHAFKPGQRAELLRDAQVWVCPKFS